MITSPSQILHLSIGQPVRDVAQSFAVRELPREFDDRRRDVDAEDSSRDRGAASFTSGLTRPAAYVEYVIGGTNVGGSLEALLMQARLSIEQLRVPDPMLARGLVCIDPRPDIPGPGDHFESGHM